MSLVSYELYPRIKASGSGSWTEEDPNDIQHVGLSMTPNCAGTVLYYDEHGGDDAQIRFRLDYVDVYSASFTSFELRIYICSTDAGQPTDIRFNVGSETFYFQAQNYTGYAQWYTATFTPSSPISASVLNFAELWITAYDHSHSDLTIPTVYIVATGEYDADQWDSEDALIADGCSGFRVHKAFGGVVVGGENDLTNHWIGKGGILVGDFVKYGKGGVLLDGSSQLVNAFPTDGGLIIGGTTNIEVPFLSRGGIIVGSPVFANGFTQRIPLTIPASELPLVGVIIGTPLYVPYLMSAYQIEDSEGNILPHEIVSTNGKKLSVFFKMNVKTEEQTVYFYGKGVAE